MSRSHNEGNAAGTVLLFLPVFFVTMLFASIGWVAAVRGASFRTVKFLLLPIIWLLTQFFGGMAFLCIGWFITGIMLQNMDAANWIVGHTADLTMLTTLFGEKDLPTEQIVIFQVILWIVMGRPFARHVTVSIYDFAIQTIAQNEQVHPYHIRDDIRKHDKEYEKADDFYAEAGKPPLLGLVLVAISRTPVSEYY